MLKDKLNLSEVFTEAVLVEQDKDITWTEGQLDGTTLHLTDLECHVWLQSLTEETTVVDPLSRLPSRA